MQEARGFQNMKVYRVLYGYATQAISQCLKSPPKTFQTSSYIIYFKITKAYAVNIIRMNGNLLLAIHQIEQMLRMI